MGKIKPEEVNGWTFCAESSHISGNAGLLALSRELADPFVREGEVAVHPFCVHGSTRSLKPCMCGSALVMGVSMHLPEAVFGTNHVTMRHKPSGFTLRFDAKGALRCWARDSVQQGSRGIRVPPAAAPAWRERMAAARQRASVDVDWTFRSDSYSPDGEVHREYKTSEALAQAACPSVIACGTGCAQQSVRPPAIAGGTSLISLKGKGAQTDAAANKGGGDRLPVQWTRHLGPALDPSGEAGRLLRQQDPILWSCDVPLYLDAMHDHGETELRVRVRVTNKCFLVLMRHHLVINGVMIAHKEVRYFHKFGDSKVLRVQTRQSMSLPPAARGMRLSLINEQQASRMLASAAECESGNSERPAVSSDEMDLSAPYKPPPEGDYASLLSNSCPRLDSLVTVNAPLIPPVAQSAPTHTPNGGPGGNASPQLLQHTQLLSTPLSAPMAALALSSDGQMLAAADCDGTLLLLEARGQGESDRPLCHERWRVTAAHSGAATALGFLARRGDEGGLLVSTGEDGTCKLWPLSSAPDSTALGSVDSIKVWALDCETADRAYTSLPGGLKAATPIVQALACEDTTQPGTQARLCVAVGASVFLLEQRMHDPALRLSACAVVTALGYAYSLRRLCASGYGGVSIWSDFGWGKALARLPFLGPLDSMSVAPDERYIACGAQDATLVMWPLAEEESSGEEHASELGVDQDKALSALLSRGSNGKELRLLRGQGAASLQLAATLDEATAAQRSGAALFFGGGAFEHKVVPVAWNRNGRLCASAGGRCPVVWDMGAAGSAPPVRHNGRAARLLGQAATVTSLAFASPRNGHPTSWSHHSGSTFLQAVRQRHADTFGLSHGAETRTARLASASTDGRVAVYELPESWALNGGEDSPGMAFSPVAVSPPLHTVRGGHPIIIWGSGASEGWLFCGLDRQLIAYSM